MGSLLLCGLLVQDILILAHALSLNDAELLTLLIPAPLVDLRLSEVSLCGYVEQCLLGPVRIGVKGQSQFLQLHSCLPFAFANDALHLATDLIVHVATTFGVWDTACC